MASTFTWQQHPAHPDVVVVTTPLAPASGTGANADLASDLQAFGAWLRRTYPQSRVFALLGRLQAAGLVLGPEQEQLLARATADFVRAFSVRRGAYVIASATMRMQYHRVFREQGLYERFRAFEREQDALGFLLTRPTV